MNTFNLVRTYGKNRLAKTTVFEPQGREFDRTPAYSVRKGIKPGFSRKRGNDLTLAVEEEN